MKLRKNNFKAALMEGRQQVGLWSGIRDTLVTEMLAGCGFDWMLLDCEHAPNGVQDVLAMMQAMSAYDTQPMVRATSLNAPEIKRLLDVGAQNILVPYVQTVEEAEAAAAAVAYPPDGIRGVGGSTRASRFGTVEGYFPNARSEIFLAIQIETQDSLDRLEEIAGVDGVDGVFIGPADLATSMGYWGDFRRDEVREAILGAMKRIRALGKPAGFLAVDQALLDEVVEAGSLFTAIDIDLPLLRRAATARLKDTAHWTKG